MNALVRLVAVPVGLINQQGVSPGLVWATTHMTVRSTAAARLRNARVRQQEAARTFWQMRRRA